MVIFSVKEPKPGAKVYARFSDPVSAIDSRLPIFLAGHFYGAGRVFFIASGEMWRLRQIEDGYFRTVFIRNSFVMFRKEDFYRIRREGF